MKIVDKTQKRTLTLEITLSEQEISDLQCLIGNLSRDTVRKTLEEQNRGKVGIVRNIKSGTLVHDHVDKMSERITDLTEDIYNRIESLYNIDGCLYD